MKEIKFRAWDGHKFFDSCDFWISADGHAAVFAGDGNIRFTHWDLMQYTGLTDKNDVEIYEGDIIRYCVEYANCNPYVDEIYEAERVGVVSLTGSKGAVLNQCRGRDSSEGDYLPDLNFEKQGYSVKFSGCGSEVIGTIYENPELLEG